MRCLRIETWENGNFSRRKEFRKERKRLNEGKIEIFEVRGSRFPCCVLLALSWNTNENPSTDKLSRAVNKGPSNQNEL